MVGEARDHHLRRAAHAVGIIIQRPCGAVIDQMLIGCGGSRSIEQIGRSQRARSIAGKRAKGRAIERDMVYAEFEILDDILVRTGGENIENEAVCPGAASQCVAESTAV